MKKALILLVMALVVGIISTQSFAGNATDADVTISMEQKNPKLQYSSLCKIHGDTAYLHITGSSSYLAEYLWHDLQLLQQDQIKKAKVFMFNPGGSGFAGTGIMDQIRGMKTAGIHVTIEGYGIIASAAIPVYVSGSKRVASKNSIFLIHPGKIVKWGLFSESLKDLESQAEMMKIIRQTYADIVSSHCNLSSEEIIDMMQEDTWFTANQAKEWGMVDEII